MDSRSKPTLEDLLHLKRAERPTPEFWNSFEKELHQRQLAALVRKRSWWESASALLSPRYYLPLGASAALAITFVSIKHAPPRESAFSAGEEVAARAENVLPGGADNLGDQAVVATVAVKSATAEPTVDDRTPVSKTQELSETLPAQVANLTPWSAPASVSSPSTRSIAANFELLSKDDPQLAQTVLGESTLIAPEVQEHGNRRAEELGGVQQSSSRSGRLLASFEDRRFSPEPQAPSLVRERLARRLGDTEIGERLGRFGLEANKVLVKF